ncbi:MAG: glycoside hydrolase family 3 N-terminal domain-containing protein [Propionicimonas sp.]|uniref:glycoside hydrolase family 3 N-terminal domain-containing protein n=1 Tax=Propionicimonas sp. TaxID=1955623 RepID=UPI003D0CB020
MAGYRDPAAPTADRVSDLLGRMTLPEKVGQLLQLDAQGDLDDLVTTKNVGSLLHVPPDRTARAIELAAATRLGIPLLLADDCIHGHSFWPGATIFPTQLAMACSWNPDNARRAARITAIEATSTGFKWTFSPVLCIARDLRWGRVDETFGEDPFLIGEFASAMVAGYQGDGLTDPTAMLATAKHFAGYSETQGGRDASEADISRRKLRSWFTPPFERVAREGCRTFMIGYQSMDGIPITANRWLLNDVLKDEWGFTGVLVTDWDNVGRMVWEQKVCADHAEAAARAMNAGNDMVMTTPAFYDGAQEAIRRGILDEATIDAAVARILALKFDLGLFEDPGAPDPARQAEVIGSSAHRQANLEVARESLVLLANDGTLPLAAPSGTIAVIGPNADDRAAQLGDWAGGSGQCSWLGPDYEPDDVVTVLAGLRDAASAHGWQVTHAAGCGIATLTPDPAGDTFPDGQPRPPLITPVPADEARLAEAVATAEAADVVVLVLGDNVLLNGEARSTATLELQGGQVELWTRIAALGKPLVVVLVNGKPLVLPQGPLAATSALVEAFNPGAMGGQAVAELLFGDIEPVGRLPISFPVHVGQQPTYYNQLRGQHGNRYADLTQEPLFAFGEGRSYGRVDYGAPTLEAETVHTGDVVRARVRVTNAGARPVTETVQWYLRDLVTSLTWADKELKGATRVQLAPGESADVAFELPVAACTITDAAGGRIVEPGDFELLAGCSSRDRDLRAARFTLEVS